VKTDEVNQAALVSALALSLDDEAVDVALNPALVVWDGVVAKAGQELTVFVAYSCWKEVPKKA
jgi:hypothetical protein